MRTVTEVKGGLVAELGRFSRFLLSELKPKGPMLTPFNLITGGIMAVGVVLLAIRFIWGLGAITNLDQTYPWGIWVGFDVVTGVAFAGGAYVVTFMFYILNMKQYESIVHATVLNGLLAYIFYAGALLLDLGRPWHVANPIIGNGFGLSSVLFLVAWHFMLYMMAEFLEFSPVVAEWAGWKRARRMLSGMTMAAVIFGISLSTLHQSGLGALFLMAKSKIHPLWYTEFIPILFFVSSIFAGLSMVIFEGSISMKVFSHRLDVGAHEEHDKVMISLARVAAIAMFVYLVMKVLVLEHGQLWSALGTGWGAWYLTEVVGLTLVPAILFSLGARKRHIRTIQVAATMALLGVMLNRLNISVIAFRWDAAVRYVPSWQEIWVTLTVISAEIWVFRWVVNRMPVLGHGKHESPRLVQAAK